MEHQVKEVKISTTLYSINHCQKWKFFQNSSNFLAYDSMFVNSYCTTQILRNFVLVYISQINLLDSSATQWVFNLKIPSLKEW